MRPSRRQAQQDSQRAAIQAAAWQQIERSGASALSLGAVARALDLTPPALYRYFKGRNALVSALIAEAYLDFIAALEAARDAVPPADPAGRLRALCRAYRAWALRNPQRYDLLFGDPVPGFRMNARARQAADGGFLILLDVIQAARLSSSMKTIPMTPALRARFRSLQRSGRTYPAAAIYLALAAWSFVHGIVSLELHGHYRPLLAGSEDDFALLEFDRFLRTIPFEGSPIQKER